MFKKEAEEILNNHCDCELLFECMTGIRCRCSDFEEEKKLLLEGIEFGYNKANEWHYVKDRDLPEKGDADFIRILIVHHNHITIANYDGDWKSTAGHKISIPYAWKELPKPPREESELSEKNTK